MGKKKDWPVLNFGELKETVTTVQLWTQIVGKIRLSKTPWTNHSWHVTLYVSAIGLTTGSIPFEQGVFQIDFDFVHHTLAINTSGGKRSSMNLHQRNVADFYKELIAKLDALGINVSIYTRPNEIDLAIPFEKDDVHCAYDSDQMYKLWQAWVKIYPIFTKFRARFIGKCSPVHLFWGAFDLAVTRFSGRTAPPYAGGVPNIPLAVMQEAYSHEVSSCGFWPGNNEQPIPVFYAYCYPTPGDFGQQQVTPNEAFFSKEMGEFLLPYEAVINADDPEAYLMEFLQSTYEAAANTGKWDRVALEADFSRFERKK
jgi:hypothetical protein